MKLPKLVVKQFGLYLVVCEVS